MRHLALLITTMLIFSTAVLCQTNSPAEEAFRVLQKKMNEESDYQKKADLIGDFLEEHTGDKGTIRAFQYAVFYYVYPLNNPTGAVKFLEKHLKNFTPVEEFTDHYVLLADVYGKAGESEKLAALVEKLEAGSKLGLLQQLAIAEAAEETGNWNLVLNYSEKYIAESTLEACVKQMGEERGQIFYRRSTLAILTYRAHALIQIGQYNEALECLDEAIRISPPNFMGVSETGCHYYYGLAKLNMGERKAALDHFAIDGLFGRDKKSLEQLRQLYVEEAGSEEGYEQFLAEKRLELAQPAPDFTLVDHKSGETLTLSEFRGKVVLLNFFSTTCGPCKLELPLLKPILEKYQDRGLEMIIIAPPEDTNEAVREYLQTYQLPFFALADVEGEGNVGGRLYGVSAFPTTFLIGRDGKAMYYLLGYGPGGEQLIEDEILDLLAT